MNTANYLFPLARTKPRSRLVIAVSGVLMLVALCALSASMTVLWLVGQWRAAH